MTFKKVIHKITATFKKYAMSKSEPELNQCSLCNGTRIVTTEGATGRTQTPCICADLTCSAVLHSELPTESEWFETIQNEGARVLFAIRNNKETVDG